MVELSLERQSPKETAPAQGGEAEAALEVDVVPGAARHESKRRIRNPPIPLNSVLGPARGEPSPARALGSLSAVNFLSAREDIRARLIFHILIYVIEPWHSSCRLKAAGI
jgi:hypothetical protein